MTIRIEIKLTDTENGRELSYSQHKATYSRKELLKRLDEYEKEMIK